MQLTVDTETTLEIERNMSAVDDLQSNKVETLNFDDLNKTCNGKKEVVDVDTADVNENNDDANELQNAIAHIPTDKEDNEAELSNVDLSEVICKNNIVQAEESQINSSEMQTNGLDNDQKENDNESKDVVDEEYLEDDIISINEEPFSEITQPQDATENIVKKNDLTEQVIDTEKDTIEIIEEAKETPKQIEDENDVIEVIEDTPAQTEKVTEEVKQEEMDKDGIEIVEDEKEMPVNNDKKLVPEEDKDVIELIEESEDISSQCEENIKEPKQEKQSKMETTENVEVSVVQPEKETKLTNEKERCEIDTAVENENSGPTETKIVDSVDDVVLVEETTVATDTVKDSTNEEQMEDSSVQSDNKVDLGMEEDKENTVSCEVKSKSDVNEKSVAKITQDMELDNDTDSLPEVVWGNKVESKAKEETQGDDKNTTDMAKCPPAAEVSNIDEVNSPIEVKDDIMDTDEVVEKPKNNVEAVDSPIELKDDMEVDEAVENNANSEKTISEEQRITPVKTFSGSASILDRPICKLSNTLDILSDDDDEETPKVEPAKSESPAVEATVSEAKEKQCINLEDDDDIMVIDEEASKTEPDASKDKKEEVPAAPTVNTDSETGEKTTSTEQETTDLKPKTDEKVPETQPTPVDEKINTEININEKEQETKIEKPLGPLVPENFLKTAKKKLSDMTRQELEEFCILKIVESIVDRSSLSDIKNKLKTMSQGLEEHRKKTMMLTKQNRDLQVVLKSVQEEQRKATPGTVITPLKITRSVGMQVFMEKTAPRKKGQTTAANKTPQNKNNTPAINPAQRPQKPATQNIPVPRLVPAYNPALKTPSTVPQVNQSPVNSPNKTNPPNGLVKNSPPVKPEKRPFNKMASSSVTVDLTDDEPPAKMPGGPRTSPAPPVRLVPPQNLMAPQRQAFGTNPNNSRKVYIPISGPQSQSLRPGQTIMLKPVAAPGVRPRCPTPQMNRPDSNSVRMNRARHPAPLPFAMKQYQPPNWKALPPAPDLKLSKVENGIVISWKIEGIPEDSYEEIASYQLYAYQETSTPPSTSLWKKIGDVKALPLPMACTLTQFMAGYKYYFAVRAVDIRSRLGPFSLPGSILLLSKNI